MPRRAEEWSGAEGVHGGRREGERYERVNREEKAARGSGPDARDTGIPEVSSVAFRQVARVGVLGGEHGAPRHEARAGMRGDGVLGASEEPPGEGWGGGVPMAIAGIGYFSSATSSRRAAPLAGHSLFGSDGIA